MLGLPAHSLFDPIHVRPTFEALVSSVLSRERTSNEELPIISNSGEPHTLLVSGTARVDSSSQVIGAIFIGQDITARNAAERRVKEQARALIDVREMERLRLSRDLHDGVAQDLVAARMGLETLFDGISSCDDQVRERVVRITAPLSAAYESIRAIAHDLRPTETGKGGLAASIGGLCVAFGRAHNLRVAFQVSGADEIELAPEHSVNIYRIAQEALSNVARHARAGRVDVTLVHVRPDLILQIVDDGAGFDVERALAEAAGRGRMGLLGLRERATILGGVLTVTSKPGRGAQVRLVVPLSGVEGPS